MSRFGFVGPVYKSDLIIIGGMNCIPQSPLDDEAFKQWYINYHGFLHSAGQGCGVCDRYTKLTGESRDK